MSVGYTEVLLGQILYTLYTYYNYQVPGITLRRNAGIFPLNLISSIVLFFDGQIYDNMKEKPLRDVYNSKNRKKAINIFKKFSSDKCPFLEQDKLKKFEQELSF